jgi:acetamidase/formamidase
MTPPHTKPHIPSDRTNFGLSHEFEPIARIAPGDDVLVDVVEASSGQLTPRSTAADLPRIDIDQTNPGTGPIWVEGAEPGDVLQIDILEVETDTWGWTAVSPGFGLLDDAPEDWLYIWQLSTTQTRFVRGITIPIEPFCGLIAVAPAKAGVHWDAPRRIGGNLDIKQLAAGSSLYLPVEVKGALLTVGDAHAAQGDGEVCGSAIECSARVRLRVALQPDLRLQAPQFETHAGVERESLQRAGYHVTTGLGSDLRDAARASVQHMIEWLQAAHELTFAEAYALCSVCVDLRISETVNDPTWIVSAFLPKDIFPH